MDQGMSLDALIKAAPIAAPVIAGAVGLIAALAAYLALPKVFSEWHLNSANKRKMKDQAVGELAVLIRAGKEALPFEVESKFELVYGRSPHSESIFALHNSPVLAHHSTLREFAKVLRFVRLDAQTATFQPKEGWSVSRLWEQCRKSLWRYFTFGMGSLAVSFIPNLGGFRYPVGAFFAFLTAESLVENQRIRRAIRFLRDHNPALFGEYEGIIGWQEELFTFFDFRD
jgi:hypothetical protein